MQALNVLYHSPVCLPSVRADIVEFMVSQGDLAPGEEPPRERIYPPVGTLALDRFCDVLTAEAHSLRQIVPDDPSGTVVEPQLSRWPRATARELR